MSNDRPDPKRGSDPSRKGEPKKSPVEPYRPDEPGRPNPRHPGRPEPVEADTGDSAPNQGDRMREARSREGEE